MTGYLGGLQWERNGRRAAGRQCAGEYVQVRLSEATWEHGLSLVAEIRTMADGRTFLGVTIQGPGGEPHGHADDMILSWNNLDPATWLNAGKGQGFGNKWPDVTPRPGIDPGSLDALARDAAWRIGNAHNIARYDPNGEGKTVGPWDASDWAAAAERYWHEIALGFDRARGPEVQR